MEQKPTQKLLHLLVVCHGNICRSPLAAAVLKQELGDTSDIRSRGFGPSGRRAAKKIREYASQYAYDLSEHRSTVLTQTDVDWTDLIVYMDGGNRKRLTVYPGAIEKARCLGESIGLKRIDDPNFVPYGDDLTRLLDLIVEAAESLASELLTPVAH